MKKILTVALLLTTLAGVANAQQVSGGVVVSNGYRGQPQYSAGVYVQQPPVVYYGQPAPVYYARPVVAPPPVYYPRPYYYPHNHWGHYHHEYRHHHHHGWR